MRAKLRISSIVVLALACMSSLSVQAAIVEFFEVPTNWKLENYLDVGVQAWFTSTSCTSGHLIFPSNTSAEHQNRFFALVLAAKIANRPVFVRYQNQDCSIVSFGVQSP